MRAMVNRSGLALLILLCASFCLTQLAEVDLHWHLLAGERILQERRVPRVDTFTYTSAGRPWIDLHWLFQVLVAVLYGRAGWAGLDALKIVLVAGAFLLVLTAALRRGASGSTVAPLLGLSIVASQERFTLRPEALSFLFLAVLLLLMVESERRPRLLAAVPPLLALWANCHALYVVGLAVLVGVAAGDSIERRLDRAGAVRSARSPGAVAWTATASLGATLLNPYGWAGWVLPCRLLFERLAANNVYARTIAEFQPPLGGYEPTASIASFVALVTVVLLACVVGRRTVRPADGVVLAELLTLALLARRNIPLFALAAVPCAAPALEAARGRVSDRIARLVPGGAPGRRLAAILGRLVVPILALALLRDVWSNRFFERDGTQRYFGRGPAPGFYPEGAADFVLRARVPGEVIHDMTTGGYLAWRFSPSRRTFIDGRLEVHDMELYSTYLRMQTDPEVFEAAAKRYDARTVIWSHRDSGQAAPLLRYLAGGHGWHPIFVDLAASVFTRDAGPGGPPVVDLGAPGLGTSILDEERRAAAAAEARDPAPAFVRRLLPRREVPVAEVSAALFFGAVGSDAIAEALLREALAKAPRNAVLHYDLGLALDRAGRSAEARREFETALLLGDTLSAAREALALVRLRDGDAEGALADWGAAERRAPLSPASLLARGGLLAGRGRIDDAIEDYRRAVALTPRDADLRAALALLCQRRGLVDEAAAEIRRALEIAPGGCAPLVASGRISEQEGRFEEAERSFRRAAAGDDSCRQAIQALRDLQARGSRSR